MFLRCNPSVFVVEENYVILVNAKEQGIISVLINGVRYYEENSGALSSQKTFAKICVPKEVLNNAKGYTVAYKKTVKRQSYFSKFEDEVAATFEFKPLTKQDDINLYFLADIHEQYFYQDYSLYQRDFGKKLVKTMEYLRDQGYQSAFFGETLEQ